MARNRCPTCGSRQWHKEPSSGLIACSEGHVLQNYRNETREVEEMGPHAMKKRTLKSTKKKKEVGSNADPKLYHGARAKYHYFLCLQLLLRQQVAALIKLWELPPEFEVICRDIWALNLSLLPNPIPAEPYNHAQSNLNRDSETDRNVYDAPPTPNTEGPQSSPTATDDAEEQGEESDSESELDDDEMERLMKENSETSSSDDESGEKDTTSKPAVKKGARSKGHLYEMPASTIGVLVVACWTLRIPALYRDFSRIIESYELPYLDPVRLLPPSMVVHLTKHSKQALSPHFAPSTMLMHKHASRLAKKLYSSYGVFTPEANAPSILWRIVETMGGTLLYGLTKRVASILSLPLTLHASLAPGLKVIKSYDPLRHQYDNVPPEVGLIASCIIILKMVYGLDGRLRLPKDAADPACTFPRVDAFLSLLREMNEEDAKSREFIFSSQNVMQLGDVSEEMLDEYIEFCEKALLPPRHDEGAIIVNRYFPLGKGHGSEHAVAEVRSMGKKDRERAPLPAMTLNDAEDGALKPGEDYAIWNARDVLGTLPDDYALVLSRGARWVGVEDEYLGGVIEKYERRLYKRRPRKAGEK